MNWRGLLRVFARHRHAADIGHLHVPFGEMHQLARLAVFGFLFLVFLVFCVIVAAQRVVRGIDGFAENGFAAVKRGGDIVLVRVAPGLRSRG